MEIKCNINTEIGVEEWERFEELADDKEYLWKIFHSIINDKKLIESENLCGTKYISQYIMPELEEPIRDFIYERKINRRDIEIILSLYIKLLPKNECEFCDDLDCFVEKVDRHTVQEPSSQYYENN
jgi:hypothetical protein|tara:strand:+ start:1096 stop:1473 length:378 start_codon:yes stop_codon:yes gene_type:complete